MTEADTRITNFLHGSKSGPEFEPLFRSAHLQSVVAHLWPRRLDTIRFPVERRLVRTAPDVQVLVEIQRPAGRERGTVVLVHGLESSSSSGYMLGMSQAALEAGFVACRFNLRTCGGTEALSKTLYHSGMTSDLRAFLGLLDAPAHLVGFSLGGNVVLKLAGELGDEGPKRIAGVCGVSTPIDLAASCRRIGRLDNRLYERRFLRRMRRRLCATGRFRPADFVGVRSVWEFDDRVTAPEFGFRDAEDYYATQSSCGFLDRIRVPALLVQAQDDTFVPFSSFAHPAIRRNPHLELLAPAHGGHVGFLARRKPRFWLESVIMAWISRVQGTSAFEIPST